MSNNTPLEQRVIDAEQRNEYMRKHCVTAERLVEARAQLATAQREAARPSTAPHGDVVAGATDKEGGR